MRQGIGGAVLALALVAAPAVAQMSKGANVQAEIQAMLDESAAAWNRGDLKGHLADNADSIRFMTGKGPVIGKGQTEEILRKAFFRDGKPIQSLRFEQVDIRPLGTEHALVIGHFILSGGGEPERSGWFSTVWERQPAGWRVIHDHSS